ncbi:MAG: sigma-70 family RNA polymerase sigma factor [Pyrinomonadaceae bacterium]
MKRLSKPVDGDDDAFTEIFERYRLHVARVVSRYFRDRSDIEEFVQQSFTKIYFSLGKFRGNGGEAAFPAWLTRAAINVCYDEFRRRYRKPENLFTDMSDEEADYIETVADGRKPSADSSAVAGQLVERVLAGLGAEDRMAMMMVYSHEYSIEEAAGVIGITASNLNSRLFRSRNLLKKRFGYLFS